MPAVEVHLLEGYAAEDKQRLARAITDAVRFVVPAPDDAITVMLHEYPPEAYMRGGLSRKPAPALPDPARIVRDYLSAMEEREIEKAQAMLGEGFVMTFPATPPMKHLSELIEWAKDRYRFVRKTYEATEAFQGENGAVVYTRGTLHGEWPDGRPFQDVRFIDRFEVRNGKIVRQDVWNDLAEVRTK